MTDGDHQKHGTLPGFTSNDGKTWNQLKRLRTGLEELVPSQKLHLPRGGWGAAGTWLCLKLKLVYFSIRAFQKHANICQKNSKKLKQPGNWFLWRTENEMTWQRKIYLEKWAVWKQRFLSANIQSCSQMLVKWCHLVKSAGVFFRLAGAQQEKKEQPTIIIPLHSYFLTLRLYFFYFHPILQL